MLGSYYINLPTWVALVVVAGVLGTSVLASVLARKKTRVET
jgi:hypothetical protein